MLGMKGAKFNAPILLSSLWFQVMWFVAVIGREGTFVWLLIGTLITLAYCAYENVKKIWLIIVLSTLGVGLDFLNGYAGLFTFPKNHFPVWLIMLWVIFGWYAVQMKDLVNRTPQRLVLLLVSLSGGLSYFAGYKVGAVAWGLGVAVSLPVLFLEWLLLAYFLTTLFRSRWGKL